LKLEGKISDDPSVIYLLPRAVLLRSAFSLQAVVFKRTCHNHILHG